FGLHTHVGTLNIILPVGISFYTFQTMTYSIDIYRGELKPTHNFFDFALFVSFFPQLVAGPIERAKNLLPQIENRRQSSKAQMFNGTHLIFWGLFKKVFVADNLGIIVDQVYGNPAATGVEYIIATWAFAFQIYGDFSGYSDIARGTAKCLGIELMHNFRQPYFAINPSDFWQHWHISLSSWLRDYLYIPLGGNRKGVWKTHRNLFITMLLGGLWHGAAWNFVIWGAYHGFIQSLHRIIFRTYQRSRSYLPSTSSLWLYMLKAFIMFQFTCLGYIFFRAQNLDHIRVILDLIFNSSWNIPQEECIVMFFEVMFFASLPLFVMALHTIGELRPSWSSENTLFKYFQLAYMPFPVKNIVYGILTYLLCFYGAKAQSFIYFQF
ncbi:MAG: MBOAT family O-acyltransferase, partial [Thermodesulfobacteriota bacterium]|nr:MBOAT family O-acyltransferase [Thermodesulfobacteriota bacterium]